MLGVGAGTLAKASESFLLATVSVAFDVVRARLAAVGCWRTVVLLAATSSRLLRAVPKRLMVPAGAGSTKLAPQSCSPPPDAWSWRWRLRSARRNATFHACQVVSTAGRPSQSSTSHGNVGPQGQPPRPSSRVQHWRRACPPVSPFFAHPPS